ncbi:MAG: SpoIID/LytB domain-containing protein [Candidatus Caenarcaniphilales bacterium]|nr:SpoIID/LytB domain-containing protein [Candidatus Caenarcaniphilales bacterium]
MQSFFLHLLLSTVLSFSLINSARAILNNVDETILLRVLIAENVKSIKVNDKEYKASKIENLSKLKVSDNNENKILKLKICKSDKQCYFFKTKGEVFIKKLKSLSVFNHIKLKDYLSSVMVSEMPSSWHREALKAQAICARTYALKQLEITKAMEYDLKSTVADQSFKGFSKVPKFAKDLVNETKNKVVLDKYNLLAETYYSSSSGNYTASPEDTWGTAPRYYLTNKKNVSEDTGLRNWQRKFRFDEFYTKLGFNSKALNSSPSSPISKIIPSRDLAQKNLNLYIPSLNISLIGEELRHKLSLPSTQFTVNLNISSYLFNGHGFGHGIGMSQYGAKKLAEMGKTYIDILDFYYPGTKIVKI